MRRRLTNPSLGLIGVVGVILGFATFWLAGTGSPLQSNPTIVPTVGNPTQLAEKGTYPLPTRPVFNWSQSPLADSQAIVGAAAPEFELLDRTGERVRLSDFRGKAVVINFWASWCPPCRDEMPALDATARDFADQGLVVLGVNAAFSDSRTDALELADELRLSFTILFDDNGEVTEKLFGVYGLPVTFWIKPDGTIDAIVVGPSTQAEMTELANQVLE